MREALFIKKNKARWEEIRQQKNVSVDEMSGHFTQAVEDLSYARTFYARSGITRYLNNLAAKFYLNIYRNKREDVSRFSLFFKQELPMAIYRQRWYMAIALLSFILFIAIGIYSSIHDESFVKGILGDNYVAMTEQNIAEGHPFGVYGGGNALINWLGIFLNNIGVAFLMFGAGIFLGIFTMYLLFTNGIMVGAFEYIFYSHGLGVKWILVVMIHGTLELSAFTIAGGAGLALGTSFLFPGTHKRMDAFKVAAMDGGKILIGLIPVFLMAAFFESFVTKHEDMPLALSITILVVSTAYVIFYFGIYPIAVAKRLAKKQAV